MADNNTTWAQFNTLTITGRVYHAELAKGQYGEFLALTLATEMVNDGPTVTVQINSKNGLMTMFKNGHLTNGRRLTVTGHLESFTELYFDKKSGKVKRLKMPRLVLGQAQVLPGGMGPGKKADASVPDNAELDIDDADSVMAEAKAKPLVTAGVDGNIDY